MSKEVLPTAETPLLAKDSNRRVISTHMSRKIVKNRRILGSVLCSILFLILNLTFVYKGNQIQPPRPKNVVFFVTDGMGPAVLSLTRSYRQHVLGLPYNDTLFLDKHLIGSSRTRSSNSLVTDSAAGATAFSCGLKSYNGAIGVDPSKKACGTVLEAFKLAGYNTGLVVTTSITDATPAAFSAHVPYRSMEDLIAEHQLGSYGLGPMVDLMIGGGRCHFHGCRSDDRNLLKEAEKNGWTVASTLPEMEKAYTLPLLALMAPSDIPFEIDRDSSEHPSLAQQATKALELLSKSEKGFFLLVEGSRIDHCGHYNDPAAQVREVLAFDEAFAAVKRFADANADTADTVLISTSDHETGGLSVARQIHSSYPDYLWYPEVLANASHSAEYISQHLRRFVLENSDLSDEEVVKHVSETVERDLGVSDLTPEELNSVVESISKGGLMDSLTAIINTRAQIGWSTHGHSAVDVNIYGYGSNKQLHSSLLESLGGNHENIEIGHFMSKWDEEFDLNAITDKLGELL